jgi:hypothetical protein
MTSVQGSDVRTGSSWSQVSQSQGNMTTTNGQISGRTWNETQSNLSPDFTSVQGVTPNGRPYSYTCNQFGCADTRK